MDQTLFYACKDFVAAQSEGEWSDEQIADDARKMAAFIEEIRPARQKLSTEVTPQIVAMMDSANADDEAWKVAQLAMALKAAELAIPESVLSPDEDLVRFARTLFTEARRQTSRPTP